MFYSKNFSLITLIFTCILILFLSALLLCILFSTNNSYASAKSSIPVIWNLSNANEYFTGRQAALKDINDSFKNNNRMVTVTGSAGIGKTQLVKRYADNYKENYDIVWWIDSDKNKNIGEQFKALALEWNNIITVKSGNYIISDKNSDLRINTFLSTEEIVKQLKERLRVTNLSWLLIFDNTTDQERINDYLPEKHSLGHGHILVTSKNPLSWSNVMELDKFTRAESTELLIKITGISNRESAYSLADMLKDYPLALVQAASYIKAHPSITMNEYRQLFLAKRKDLWKEEVKLTAKHAAFDNYEFTVFTTLSLIIKQIEKESPESVDLLVFCSLLNNKNIPKALLTEYLNLNNPVKRAQTDTLKHENTLAVLQHYSLIQLQEIKEYRGENKDLSADIIKRLNTTFTMHEITQLAVSDYLDKEQRKAHLKIGLNVLAKFLPRKLDISIPLIEQANFMLSHMRMISANAEKHEIYNNNLITIYIRELEYFLSGKRDFPESKKLIEKIERMLPKTQKDNLVLCRFHLMRAVFYAWNDSDYTSGIRETNIALRHLEELGEGYEEEHLMTYNRLIQLYSWYGDRDNALKYAKIGEELIKKAGGFLGNQDTFYHSLAQIYMDDEQFEKAISYINRAIDIISNLRSSILEGDLPIYLLEAKILIRGNKAKTAHEKLGILFKKAKHMLQDKDNSYMAITLIFYGYSSFLINDTLAAHYDTERNVIQAGQEMLRRLFGEKYNRNRNAALSHLFIGEIYEKLGNNESAHIEYSAAEKIFNTVLGSKEVASSDTGDLYAKLAVINVKLNDPVTAQEYFTTLQKNFGFRHSKTIKVRDYFIDNDMDVGY